MGDLVTAKLITAKLITTRLITTKLITTKFLTTKFLTAPFLTTLFLTTLFLTSHFTTPPSIPAHTTSAKATPATPTSIRNTFTSSAQQDSVPIVILVRHAEKAAAPAADPPLSEAGKARAAALVSTLAGAGVTAIITTEFSRTRETAAPLAARIGVAPQVVAAQGVAGAAHIAATVAAIRAHSRGVVLVVGHSNTVPALIAALGAERMRDLCEMDYDNLFVVYRRGAVSATGSAVTATSSSAQQTASLLRSRFGASDGVELEQGSCAENLPHLP